MQRRDRGRWSQLLDGDFLRTRRGKARRLSQRALRDVHRQVRDGMFAEGLRQRQRQRQRMHYCTHLVSGIDYYLLSIMTWRHGLYASRVQTSLSAASRNRNRPSGPGGPTLQATASMSGQTAHVPTPQNQPNAGLAALASGALVNFHVTSCITPLAPHTHFRQLVFDRSWQSLTRCTLAPMHPRSKLADPAVPSVLETTASRPLLTAMPSHLTPASCSPTRTEPKHTPL
jgi:hypothetical protein